jgi:hypothetical protein
MQWMSRSAVLALLIAMVVPAVALADGGPVAPLQGAAIRVPGGSATYKALDAGRSTLVKRLGAAGAPTRGRLRIAGHYGIPGVDFSGATTGLAANGRTLLLAEIPRNGITRTTRLVVLNTPRLTVRARISLPGWSTVDAISPDGRWLYLIHYLTPTATKYEVRAYDLPARRMLAQPIVDPTDWGEAMTGFAITRVMGPGSRWAYTFYMRPSGVPFVHALDTVGRRAVCIDLPRLTNLNISDTQLTLGAGGGILNVDVDGVRRALINTSTLALITPVTTPSRAAPTSARARPAAHKSAPRRSDGVPWELFAGLLAALTVLAVGVARRSRPARAQSPGTAGAAGAPERRASRTRPPAETT